MSNFNFQSKKKDGTPAVNTYRRSKWTADLLNHRRWGGVIPPTGSSNVVATLRSHRSAFAEQYSVVGGRTPPSQIISIVIKTQRTHRDRAAGIRVKTAAPRNEIEVDFVGKTAAAGETVAEHRLRRRTRHRREKE
jgi:hypothetical protein